MYALRIAEDSIVFYAEYESQDEAIRQAEALFLILGDEARLWFMNSDVSFAVWDRDCEDEPIWVPGDSQELIDITYGAEK